MGGSLSGLVGNEVLVVYLVENAQQQGFTQFFRLPGAVPIIGG
jgi:hypothetical protein